MFQGDCVTLGDIVFISCPVEGRSLDILKVNVCISTSKLRVNVA